MIAPLRRRHRLTVASLAVALPVLYVVALAARPDEPVVDQLPPALAEAAAGEVDQDFGELVTDPAVAVRSRTDGAQWWVELDPGAPIALPEVLVYWTPSTVADRLPEDAFLIGSLAGARARAHGMPRDALGRDGTLVLYSLGHQEVVASAPLPAIGALATEESPKVVFEFVSGESAEAVP